MAQTTTDLIPKPVGELQRADLENAIKVSWSYNDYSDPTWCTKDTDDITFHLISENPIYRSNRRLADLRIRGERGISSSESLIQITPNLRKLIETEDSGYLLTFNWALGDYRSPVKYIQIQKGYGPIRGRRGQIEEGYWDLNPQYKS